MHLFLLGELFDVVDEPEFGTTLGTLLRELSVVFEKRAVVFLRLLAFHLERAGYFALQGVATGLELRNHLTQVLELCGDHAVRLQAFSQLGIVYELLDDAVKEVLIVNAAIDRLCQERNDRVEITVVGFGALIWNDGVRPDEPETGI